MVKYRDIYSVRLQLHDISLRHASNRCAPQMIKLAVATARLTILDRLVYFNQLHVSEYKQRFSLTSGRTQQFLLRLIIDSYCPLALCAPEKYSKHPLDVISN